MHVADAAIIGGTGIGPRLLAQGSVPVTIPTPYGPFRAHLLPGEGPRVLAVQRHSVGHRTPPHRVNYRSIVDGLRRAGVRVVVSSAAVGSIRADWLVGTMVVPHDVWDPSGRRQTLYDDSVVHTPFPTPFTPDVRTALLAAATRRRIPVVDGAVYVNNDGPRYESPFEIEALRRLGGDLVGMTVGTEAILFAEAGVPYGCLSVVTNLAAGLAEEIGHHAVTDAMEARGEVAVALLRDAVEAVLARAGEATRE